MGGITYGVYRMLQGFLSNTLLLIICIAVACVIYFAMVLILKMLNQHDWEYIPGGEKVKHILLRAKLNR